jgi:predicted dehydrogenase
MKVAIIGCGRIGQKRAQSLAGAELAACADRDGDRAEQLARTARGCAAFRDWRHVLDDRNITVVVVATPHDSLSVITAAAVSAGKHVLVEKPAARCADELRGLSETAQQYGSLVRVGFNHRYHRSLRKAREIVDSGALGPLLFVRARYGHGGRLGYEREWRAQPRVSGGGELIDQGTHIIDLARWFLGEFVQVEGAAHTYFWDMPVDDNAFLLLKTADRQVAFLHASCTEWKNTFSFEVFGREGKLHAEGLGGSYGVERLTWYRMLPEMGPPETTTWEYPMADDSWTVEMREFMDDIRLRRQPSVGLRDAVAALQVVEKIYRDSGYDHRA